MLKTVIEDEKPKKYDKTILLHFQSQLWKCHELIFRKTPKLNLITRFHAVILNFDF